MRNGLAVFTAVCMTTLSLGCGSSNNPGPAKKQAAGEKKALKAWSLQLKSKCADDVEESQCLAQSGFTVTSDGKWKTGKSTKGYERSGVLSPEDMNALNDTLAKATKTNGQNLKKLARAIGTTAPVVAPAPAPVGPWGEPAAPGTPAAPSRGFDTPAQPEQGQPTAGGWSASEPTDPAQPQPSVASEDEITLAQGTEAAQIIIKSINGEFNSSLKATEDAKALQAFMRTLAARYTADFPNDCKDGAPALQALMAQVQSCTVDTDCTYASDFMAVGSEEGSTIVTENNTIVNPLAVANVKALEENNAKLNELLSAVQLGCSDKFYTAATGKSFVTNGKAPECKSNVCVVNSAIQIQ